MANQRTEAIPHTVESSLAIEHANNYEAVSATRSRPYENNARRLAARLGRVEGAAVLEICSGPGNSAIVLLEEHPEIGQLASIDANRRFLGIAAYKFGKVDQVTDGFSEQAIEYRGEMKYRAAQLRKKPDFVLGRADGSLLPIKPDSVDVIFGASALHWLAFEDLKSEDISFLRKAFVDFQRVLKVGGKLAFDVSGLQFDFGEKSLNGRLLNSYHMTGHPFHIRFLKNVMTIVDQRGFRPPEFRDFGSLDRYYHIFDLQKLVQLAGEHSFELVNTNEGELYGLYIEPLPTSTLMERIKGGAKMRCFNSPQLESMPEEQKAEIIDSAFDKTLAENGNLLSQEAAEMHLTFVFRLLGK